MTDDSDHARALAGVTVRPLRSPADLAACVALQHATWGEPFAELVPPAILQVAQRLGGVAAGAFDAHGAMLGFVFGLTGIEDGRVVHWSDMLAVRADQRDRGIGGALKVWQRDAARAAGATVMYWTYDPLVARNAHVNVNRLGVRIYEYVPDMYGASDSPLHRGLGTDRLIVAWPIDAAPRASRCPTGRAVELPAVLRDAPLLSGALPDGPRPAAVRIAIPGDIHSLVAHDPAAAAACRRRTRTAFLSVLAAGYGLAGFCRDAVEPSYVLERDGG